jgi:predicted DNA-binding transcriptional regulator YafY
MKEARDVLIDAIKRHQQVTFRYKSSADAEHTVRTVEPWIYGTRNGKECLYGYQAEGGGGGGIRRYNLERVKSVALNGQAIENHPEGSGDITKWDEIFAEWTPKRVAA